ncbi:hypothetical protein AXF42_Ash017729 [Apostasia shenzhenica]|uniref:Uncharacterized protein n=1 Tax=Apostasia shenzhenica TaxID=1088818 RepID=A0A2I0B672_9ASPA|nr:hypothetical protein AXF42_Ash017729 [Apostasia shenzhenica]
MGFDGINTIEIAAEESKFGGTSKIEEKNNSLIKATSNCYMHESMEDKGASAEFAKHPINMNVYYFNEKIMINSFVIISDGFSGSSSLL